MITILSIPRQQAGMDSSDRSTRQAAADSIIQHFGFIVRHSGTGDYAGVLVALLAVFALANSCRGPNTPFSPAERRAVWFWGAAALFSILAAWGRFGFLYSLLYRLPYFSTIRNPIKFLHPFHIIWIILAGYGLEVLHRRYLQNTVKRAAFLPEHLKLWWSRAAGFEKKWVAACALVLAASLAGWVVRSSPPNPAWPAIWRIRVSKCASGWRRNMARSFRCRSRVVPGFSGSGRGRAGRHPQRRLERSPRQNGLDLPRRHFDSGSGPRRPALDPLFRL